MFDGNRDLLVGKPLRIVSIRVTHSASKTASSFMSSQVTAGTCLAWKDAQTLVEDSSMRGLDESVTGYLDVKSGPQLDLPGTWTTRKEYLRVICFS